jgi:predicted GNAT superfamily acetyltransferase
MATIRPLTGDDLPEALAINEANVPAVGTVDADQLAHLVDEASVALAAEEGGRLIGFCIVLAPGADYGSVNYGWFSERYDDFAYLDRVAVAESYRNRGIGAELYAEVERLVDAPWFTLEVNVRPRNEGSLRFHERMGFTEVGQQETPYGSRVSLLAKPLPHGV